MKKMPGKSRKGQDLLRSKRDQLYTKKPNVQSKLCVHSVVAVKSKLPNKHYIHNKYQYTAYTAKSNNFALAGSTKSNVIFNSDKDYIPGPRNGFFILFSIGQESSNARKLIGTCLGFFSFIFGTQDFLFKFSGLMSAQISYA